MDPFETMKKIEERKLHQLFLLYSQKGFDYTVEQIADMLGVTPKTIYNRYQTKEKMEQCVIDYWELRICRSLESKITSSNNAVESVLVFMYELFLSKKESYPIFLLKARQVALKDTSGFQRLAKTMRAIIAKGMEDGDFRENLNVSSYMMFLLVNTIYFIIFDCLDSEIIHYLMLPLLTPDGQHKLNEIDLESYFSTRPFFPIHRQ